MSNDVASMPPRRRVVLEKSDAPWWVYTPVSGWKRLWLCLSNAKFRDYFGIRHPALILWALLWWPVMVLALGLLLLVVAIMHGPSAARDVYENI